ncbi:MAG: class SAM-dependent methyltransferase [Bacteroidetes bacterium]|jgi:putative N6-adenine-specific DNA methylase|nr:class SAM-dependent methyltransferase [Bacteroidota bacterium]
MAKQNYKREAKEHNNLQEGDFEMIATTFFGLEDVLAHELLRLGAKNIDVANRAVSFWGDNGFMYKANLCLRTALRILKPIKRFYIQDQEEYYKFINAMEWETLIDLKDTFVVDSVINTHFFNHSQFVSQVTKDGIVDRFNEKFQDRPSVDKDDPTLRINVHIFRHDVTISLDSSGTILHKRGYREEVNLAPLKEVLAAGILLLSDWEPHIFMLDGMTGSGTFAIEAALIANKIPPGYFRNDFGFMRWKDYDQAMYETIYESMIGKITNGDPRIEAIEISPATAKIAQKNVEAAKVEDVVKVINKDFFSYVPDKPRGVLFLNPPYGERMGEDTDMVAFYKQIGDKMKKDFKGWTAWIITANMDAAKFIGLRPSRKITLYNSQLECKLLKFEMYDGTKRTHKFGEDYKKGTPQTKTEEEN